ncbi:MAG: alpha/beta fold hydrolase [Nitrospira sp.]
MTINGSSLRSLVTCLLFVVLVSGIFAPCLYAEGQSDADDLKAVQTVNKTAPDWAYRGQPDRPVIVFIHGIFGDTFGTWKNKKTGKHFFDLMKDDETFRGSGVYVYGFPSNYWTSSFSINDAAIDLRSMLQGSGVLEYDNIVLVCHSMGGLIAQRFLLANRDLAPKVRLVFFFSTPQEGADITNLARYITKNPGIEAMLPADKNDFLQILDTDWKNAHFQTEIHCALEKFETFSYRIVKWATGTRSCTNAASPIDADHIQIVKPSGRQDRAYIALKNAFASTFSRGSKLKVSGFVRTQSGSRLRHTTVRIQHVAQTETSAYGEFTIPLPRGFTPGKPVVFYVDNWILINPYEGRMYIPAPSETVEMIVANRGSSALLQDYGYVQNVVLEATGQIQTPGFKMVTREQFLNSKAKSIGLPTAELEGAISNWTKNAKAPYEKGLAALYNKDYVQAAKYLKTSATDQQGDLSQKYLSLGKAYYEMGLLSYAESAYESGRRLRPNDSRILHNLSVVMAMQKKYTEALPIARQALELEERAVGPEHQDIARILTTVAGLYALTGYPGEAEPIAKRALNIDEKLLGKDHLDVGLDLFNLGEVYFAQQKYEEAAEAFQRSLLIYDKAHGSGADVADVAEALAITLRTIGRNSEAESLEKRVGQIRQSKKRQESP